MGKPLTTVLTFKDGVGSLTISSENKTQSITVGDALANALVELSDHQLLEGVELSASEKAEFVKASSGIDYEKTFE